MGAIRRNSAVRVIFCPLTYIEISAKCYVLVIPRTGSRPDDISTWRGSDRTPVSIVPFTLHHSGSDGDDPVLVGPELVIVYFILLQLSLSSHGLV